MNECVNQDNIRRIKREIYKKLGYRPYHATEKTTMSVVTDMDHFPYTRFFRGIYDDPYPRVFDREAGYRFPQNQCYNPAICDTTNSYPHHCFQAACSTVYPCYPEYLIKDADKKVLDLELNRAIIPIAP